MAGSLNKAVLIGNLGRDPEIRHTADGKEIANFSIATSETWKDRVTGEKKEKTEWHRIVVFNEGLVSVVKNYAKKGTKVYLEGNLQTRKWVDNLGQEKYTTEIVLQNFNSQFILLDSKGSGTNSLDSIVPKSTVGNSNFDHSDLDDEIPFKIVLLSISLLFSACVSSIDTRIKEADKVASINNFEKKLVKAGDFVITTYQRVSDKDSPYVFYIEGDGSISIGRYAVSNNPTPSKVMLLKLAALDTRPNIVYIARPCQYTPVELNPNCSQIYWTDKRLAKEVIESTNIVINSISNGKPASLVGFSGGGGVAVLVAARNKHIKDIITIAGNLDIENFSKHHGIYALKESLNPIDYAIKISNIPQLHLSGAKDAIVPSKIMQGYIKASSSDCIQQKIFPNITHTKGWDKVWQDVLKINLTCGITNPNSG